MADRDNAHGGDAPSNPRSAPAQVRGTVAANGRVGKRDTDAIVAEIERTRQNLAATIDSLADRVSPASNVRRLRERAAEQAARPEIQLAAAGVVVAIAGLIAYRIWSHRRS